MQPTKFKDVIKVRKDDVLGKLHLAKFNQLSPIEIARLEGQLDILNLVDSMCAERGRY